MTRGIAEEAPELERRASHESGANMHRTATIAGLRPVLRWAGSKKQILPLLSQYWSPAYDRYIEPFCGSSALFFLLGPAKAVLSDSNAELIGFYEVLRRDPVQLWTDAISLPRTRGKYLELRGLNLSKTSIHARAVRFLYLNRNCFNGLYRTNNDGHFNVPFAPTRAGAMPSLAEFVEAANRLKVARISACDFGHTLKSAREGDFVYLDPPFFVSTRRVFRDYGPRRFVQTDIDRLDRHLERLDLRRVRFVMSFADCAEIRPLSQRWISRRVKVQRQIAGFASHRRVAYEWLLSNAVPARGSK